MREHVSRSRTPELRTPERLRRVFAHAWLLAVLPLIAALGCDRAPAPEPPSGGATAERAPARPSRAADRIVCLGDSLTAGLGLDPEQAYPALLQQRVDAAGYRYEVVNAGVSGDTSAGGLRRLNWALSDDVRVLIVALGANDGLRGLPVEELRRNLSAIIERARSQDIAVLLAGMEAPPNFGPAYTREFRGVYAGVAKAHAVAFVPFMLDGVAGVRGLNQADGIHPSADGQRAIADLLWPELERLLKALESR